MGVSLLGFDPNGAHLLCQLEILHKPFIKKTQVHNLGKGGILSQNPQFCLAVCSHNAPIPKTMAVFTIAAFT